VPVKCGRTIVIVDAFGSPTVRQDVCQPPTEARQ